ncbi:unnamed protein product [Adineta steineri]|uniref:Uncharacterized protein n=1 Tax=Adineta steineri TaxID=433720 RepID=A0A815CGY6_9BILA|nr:unnamed protein product [Adineta steineri]CAF3615302.1 unnamed protein product [Adineta steineri]
MPIDIGLLSTQQDSFEHHEELSKLLNETDVFYVPLRNEFRENNFNTNQDSTDLTKSFDEDLSNKHLVVTFRDIGYSLCLDSVKSIPDENDQSKIRVSGKMIVDGICIQFFGCFDYSSKTEKHSDNPKQQINGVGRVELDEGYYRELSSTQIVSKNEMKEEENIVEPIIKPKTRQQTAKLKERTETNKPKTRSRTASETVSSKNNTKSVSPPPPPTVHNTTQHSSTRPRVHSPSTHAPYPLRSPRTKQHRITSPVHFPTPSSSKTSEVHSSLISSGSTSFNEYSQLNSTSSGSQSNEYSQPQRLQILSHSPHFPSHTTGQTTIPIQIPTSSNTNLPLTSLSNLSGLFQYPQSHSLPTYILPSTNLAYITTATNPIGTSYDLTPLNGNTNIFLISNPNQHSAQPVHILTPIDHRSLQFTHYTSANLFQPPPPPVVPIPSRICNILQTNESMSILQNKRHDNEEDKPVQQVETNKQFIEQLPFKKRRYTGQQTRMASVHNDDNEVSDESAKK